MRLRKAFSLRDLVALLCLAGLGLPILAASVQGTVSKSVAERCRTNLAALTRCIMVYTEQNRGYMPVDTYRVYDGPVPEAPSQPDRTAVAFSSASGINPVTGLYADARGFGLLYVRGLARPPELFYCPAPILDHRHMLSNYPKPWGSHIGPGSVFIRIGYMWNPWVKDIGDSRYTYEDRLLLRQHPGNWPLVCDLVMSRDTTGHVEGNSAIWNMAYPDGHVAPFADQLLYDLFATGFDAARIDWAAFNAAVRPRILPPAGP